MRDMTLSEIERLGAAASEADETFQMDEDAFRLFYDRTARPVWAYLSRMTGDARLADDLLQESVLPVPARANVTHDSEAHRRNYLFRIATNLVHDIAGGRARTDADADGDGPRRSGRRDADVAVTRRAAHRSVARDGAAQAARARRCCGWPTRRDHRTRRSRKRSASSAPASSCCCSGRGAGWRRCWVDADGMPRVPSRTGTG